jgi:hypothetical protein
MKYEMQVSDFAPQHPYTYGTDRKLKIFYDETNNIRKLILKDDGFNVSKYDNFVLGGVALEGDREFPNIEDLRRIIRIQDSAPEIKFDHVAKGSFEKVLSSKKLHDFFSWLLENKVNIHYANVNILNWAILDIVESLMAEEQFEEHVVYHRAIKNEFYRVVASDVPSFLNILKSYGYPNIEKNRTGAFLKNVREFVIKQLPLDYNNFARMLRDLLLEAQTIDELAFLVDERPDQVIDSFKAFFIDRITTFPNSDHIFDEEKTIQAAIGGLVIKNGESEVNFRFADSVNEPGVQLSDIVVGFLGKYFTFIEKTPLSALIRFKERMEPMQKANINLLMRLIEQSDRVSNGLLHRITTLDSDLKSDYFIFDINIPAAFKKYVL